MSPENVNDKPPSTLISKFTKLEVALGDVQMRKPSDVNVARTLVWLKAHHLLQAKRKVW